MEQAQINEIIGTGNAYHKHTVDKAAKIPPFEAATYDVAKANALQDVLYWTHVMSWVGKPLKDYDSLARAFDALNHSGVFKPPRERPNGHVPLNPNPTDKKAVNALNEARADFLRTLKLANS